MITRNELINKYDLIKIEDNLYYLASEINPILSAEVTMYFDPDEIWIYDIGHSVKSKNLLLDMISYCEREKIACNIVSSHFHEDHMGNLEQLAGDFTLYTTKALIEHYKGLTEHIPNIILPSDNIFSVNTHIILYKIPSIHCKGCLGLEINKDYFLVGDSLYCKHIDGHVVYNQQLLRDQIKLFKSINAQKFIVSHDEKFVCDKEEVITKLEKILTYAVKDNAYIVLGTKNHTLE